MPTDSSPEGTRISREFTFNYEIGTVSNQAGDSVGVGIALANNEVRLWNQGEELSPEPGPFLIVYYRDSLDLQYFLPGSKAAWSAISPKLDSLYPFVFQTNNDSVAALAAAQYNALTRQFDSLYIRVKVYAKTACSYSATGTARIPGNPVQKVPLVFSSVTASSLGMVLLIDLKASKPQGLSSTNFVGDTATGVIRATCPDPG